MCIIAICRTRKLTKEEFENCFVNNSDGAGFMWHDGEKKKNVMAKGFMQKETAWEYYDRRVNNLPHVAHFRKETSGGVRPELTHPYIVDEGAPLSLEYEGETPLLVHNGIASGWKDFLMTVCLTRGIRIPQGQWSDTRAMALGMYYLGEEAIPLQDDRSKYVVLNEEGEVYVHAPAGTNSFQQSEDKAVLFSNGDFRRVFQTTGWQWGGQQGAYYYYGKGTTAKNNTAATKNNQTNKSSKSSRGSKGSKGTATELKGSNKPDPYKDEKGNEIILGANGYWRNGIWYPYHKHQEEDEAKKPKPEVTEKDEDFSGIIVRRPGETREQFANRVILALREEEGITEGEIWDAVIDTSDYVVDEYEDFRYARGFEDETEYFGYEEFPELPVDSEKEGKTNAEQDKVGTAEKNSSKDKR